MRSDEIGGLRASAFGVVLIGLGVAPIIWTGVPVSGLVAQVTHNDLAAVLDEAEKANAATDPERERDLLERAETMIGDPEQIAEVQRRLAVLDWKVYRRDEDARLRLVRAANGFESDKAWLALARMEWERQAFGRAREASDKAWLAAQEEPERQEARLATARAVIGQAVANRRAGRPIDAEDLQLAADLLRTQIEGGAGQIETSRLLLRAALLLNRGEEALTAWRSYFNLDAVGQGPNLLATAGSELGRILPTWSGGQADARDRMSLLAALASSRLFLEASLIALDPAGVGSVMENSRAREILAYADAVHELRAFCREYYRETLAGEDHKVELRSGVLSHLAPVVAVLEGGPRRDPLSEEEAHRLLAERFGTYLTIGPTAGQLDLHMGHRIHDEARTVEQYGRRAEIRFVALDNMVSNGFQSWAWEGGHQHGGWARADTIYQVRTAYADAPTKAWRQLVVDGERRKNEADIRRETVLDEARAEADPYGFLAGLALRLQRQGARDLNDELAARGLEAESLRLTFLATYERDLREGTIFAHEGRHAIDLRAGVKGNLEFTAKLSEVALAPRPRLAMDGILGSSIGDPTPHGQAGAKIMEGLVRWMERHHAEIAGLDTFRPLLPQLDLLSDDQLRSAFRSMDPLAAAPFQWTQVETTRP